MSSPVREGGEQILDNPEALRAVTLVAHLRRSRN